MQLKSYLKNKWDAKNQITFEHEFYQKFLVQWLS